MENAPILSDEDVVNGICLQFVQMLKEEVHQQPELAIGRWRIESEWTGQTGSVSRIKKSQIGGDDLVRNFEVRMDQPHELCGGNAYATPQEHLIAAIAGCLIANFSAVCAQRHIELSRLEVNVSGTTDMRGLYDISSFKSSGFKDIQFEIEVAGNASDEELFEIFEYVKEISPNLSCFGQATPFASELVISSQ